MMRLRELAAVLSAASRALADEIARGAHPERGWTLANWGWNVSLSVAAARARRDVAAAAYRAELIAVRRALVGRPPGHVLAEVSP